LKWSKRRKNKHLAFGNWHLAGERFGGLSTAKNFTAADSRGLQINSERQQLALGP
jgi:hypothetical protein